LARLGGESGKEAACAEREVDRAEEINRLRDCIVRPAPLDCRGHAYLCVGWLDSTLSRRTTVELNEWSSKSVKYSREREQNMIDLFGSSRQSPKYLMSDERYIILVTATHPKDYAITYGWQSVRHADVVACEAVSKIGPRIMVSLGSV
jgi:hypothetical protein